MKTLLRVLMILVVASIIGGLMVVGVNASSGSAAGSTNFEEGGERPPLPEGAEFRPDGERDERGGFGFPGGGIKALVLMSIAGGIYSIIAWAGKRAKSALAG